MPESNTWLHQITTPYNACSLETLPPLPDGDGGELIPLVVGCYQLNESSSDEIPGDNADHADETREKAATRSGELRLYMIRRDLRFKEPCVVPMESGILDGKWKKSSSNGKSPLFASACASGRIHLHSLVHDDKSSLRLDQIASPNVDDGSNVLCLSLAWDDYTQNASDRIVSSYSDGTIALHDVSYSQDEGEQQNIVLEESQRWDAHSMFGCPSEVWTCSFLRGDENVVMSGADDVSTNKISNL
jgi:diphthamide biosynthesis protein 7